MFFNGARFTSSSSPKSPQTGLLWSTVVVPHCRPRLLAVTSTSSATLQGKVNPLVLALPQDLLLKGLPVVSAIPNYTFLLSKHTLGDSSVATSCQSWLGHSVLFQQGCEYFNLTDRSCKTNGCGPLHKAAACVIWKLPKAEHTLGVPQVFVLQDLHSVLNVYSCICDLSIL